MTEMCVVCRGRFESATAGRRGVYCSPACRQRRDRELATAQRELAKDSTPRDVEGAYRRARLLWTTWTASDPANRNTYSALRADLLSEFWGGSRPPTRLLPPSREAVRALGRRIERLDGLVRAAEEKAGEEFRRAEREAVRREEAERVKAAQDADKTWRRELLKGV